jgi:O-antigen biosynthesis protein WbqV
VLIEQVFAEYKPEIVFHAAALKHVPLVESNSCEAVLTNILGTKNIADSCLKYSAEKMILISTDKAVNPTNVMGATKKAAESYVHSLGNSSTYTNFVTVRFGNVLGSSGSVIPLFERQLKAGGPLTVTHPNMVRFFMTVREAVGLVLQASSIKVNDERGAIFVLDMGEPLKIKDLAMQIIKMAGLRPDIDIEIVYTGIRPGEKLFEELFYASEQPKKTAHQSIMLACPVSLEQSMLLQLLNDIEVSALSYNQAETLSLLKKIVPEYQTPIQ